MNVSDNVSDETLMALADGELDAEAAARIEEAVRADPQLSARLEAHRALRARLASAYAADLEEPVPQRLLDAAMRPAAGAAQSARIVPLAARRARARWIAPLPLAAAASLLLGIGVGFLVWHSSGTSLRESARGALVADGRLADALSNQLSGAGAPGGVDIGLSFRSRSGAYCRTFRIAHAGAPAGLACRDGADWRVAVLAQESGDAGTDAGFRTAGSSLPPAVLQAVQARIADQPLDRAGEVAARAHGWRTPPR